MLQANELRIGNLINSKIVGSNYMVTGIVSQEGKTYLYTDLQLSYSDLEDWQGIPLTPEILESAGFSYDEREDENGISYWDRYLNDRVFSVAVIEGSFYFIDIVLPSTTYKTMLYHLHQLQNLYFALTGEELEVDLTSQKSDAGKLLRDRWL